MSARDPNAPWDRQWRVAKPDDYVPGLYRLHQIGAFDVLRKGYGLTEWEAEFLQLVAYQSGPLSTLQRYWLERIERERLGEMA